jgi:exodeoxyribonuclease X
MLIRCIDFETTGFPPGAAVIEAGWTDVYLADDGQVTVAPTVSLLVNPFRTNPELKMSPSAQAVHLISMEDLDGMPPPDAAFRRIMAGAPDVFLAHNCEFEREFFTGGEGSRWICTLKAARRLWPEATSHKLQELRFSIPIEVPDREFARAAHRAGPDTYVNAYLVKDILARMAERGLAPEAAVEQLVQWTASPSLLARLPFGKHKGVPLAEVPADYLVWLKGTKPDRDLNFTIKTELARRAKARTEGRLM